MQIMSHQYGMIGKYKFLLVLRPGFGSTYAQAFAAFLGFSRLFRGDRYATCKNNHRRYHQEPNNNLMQTSCINHDNFPFGIIDNWIAFTVQRQVAVCLRLVTKVLRKENGPYQFVN